MTLENNNTVTQREHPAFEDDYIAPHRRPSDVSDRLAFTGEGLGDGAADAATGTGDDGNLTSQSIHSDPPVVHLRPEIHIKPKPPVKRNREARRASADA